MLLLFVFFVATLNLAVGYALGAGWTVAMLLDRLPRRAAKKPVESGDDEPTLTKPSAATSKKSAPPAAPPAPAATSEHNKAADVVAGLSAFREQLAAASIALKESEEDPDAFEQNATKLQEANHAYLEEAGAAIRDLDKLGADGDTAATATAEAVTTGKDEVAQISGEIDGIIEGGIDEQARAELVAKSEAVADAADRAETAAAETATTESAEPAPEKTESPAPAAESNADPNAVFGAIDELFDLLEACLAEADDQVTRYVAAIRVDPIADHEADDAVLQGVEAEVAELASGLLEDNHSLVKGRPSMILFNGDTLEEATERVENIRKAVESAGFDADGESCQATVTCALLDANLGDTREALIDNFSQALEEGLSVGGNRTFHHDGAFPTAVPAGVGDEADE